MCWAVAYLDLPFGAHDKSIVLQILQSRNQSQQTSIIAVIENEFSLHIDTIAVQLCSTRYNLDGRPTEDKLAQLKCIDAYVEGNRAAQCTAGNAFHIGQAETML